MSWKRFADQRDRISSTSGGWSSDGRATLHGFDIHHELVPNASWMQTVALAVTGRFYSTLQARLMEAMLVVTGYPDPRLWCNRVAALAGSARVPAAASLASGLASSEATIYGWQAEYHAACLLQRANRIYHESGESSLRTFIKANIRKSGSVYGFGRPVVHVEERIAPIDAMAQRLGIPSGPHRETAECIERMLKKHRQILNYGGYVAVRLLDLGFSPLEVYRISVIGFYIGLLPCYIEAFDKEPGTFLPIACEDILYEGRDERPLPE